MKILDENMPERPEINYPTQWSYKLIGRDLEKLVSCVQDAMKEVGDKSHTCTQGNVSKNGKFHAYNTTCTVESEEERNKIFKYFEAHQDVEMVI